jgi:hypothetical protein
MDSYSQRTNQLLQRGRTHGYGARRSNEVSTSDVLSTQARLWSPELTIDGIDVNLMLVRWRGLVERSKTLVGFTEAAYAALGRCPGLLDDDMLEKLSRGGVECSHRCFNAACINIAHIVLKNNQDNKNRRMCHDRWDDPDAPNIPCVHEPECVESTKHDLNELERQIARFKTHIEDMNSTVAKHCPFPGCKKKKVARTEEKLLIHLVNKHSPGPIPPIDPEFLSWKCPRCNTFLVADKSIRDHIDAAQGTACPPTPCAQPRVRGWETRRGLHLHLFSSRHTTTCSRLSYSDHHVAQFPCIGWRGDTRMRTCLVLAQHANGFVLLGLQHLTHATTRLSSHVPTCMLTTYASVHQ